jgi:hypothetical protein
MPLVDRVPIIWHEKSSDADCRSNYGGYNMLRNMFTVHPNFSFANYNTWPTRSQEDEGFIIVVHGGNESDKVQEIQKEISSLKWVLLILMCDEESQFDVDKISHPRCIIWQQIPAPHRFKNVRRYLPYGYQSRPHDMVNISHSKDKPLDWFFSGQITHARRRECVGVLKQISNGRLIEGSHFQDGLEYSKYLQTMAMAKIAPCPSGPATPDTFRVWEALQANCIPVVDDRPGARPNYPRGYWRNLFGEEPPFPILENWQEFPQVLNHLLQNWDNENYRVQKWWAQYQQKISQWLKQDIEELRICE